MERVNEVLIAVVYYFVAVKSATWKILKDA